MADPIRALLTALLLAAVPVALAGHRSPAPVTLAQEVPEREPAPVPYIEREEVRFVTLDIVAEEKARGWRPLRNLTIAEIEVRVGDRLMAVDQFEDHCRPEPPPGPSSAPTRTGSPETSASPTPEFKLSGPSGSAGFDRYILYFDMEHLNMAGRDAAFRAARAWAADRLAPADEVMIITAGRGLRIVRTFIPAADHLREDLEEAQDDFRSTELWGALEGMRLLRLGDEHTLSARRNLAKSYTEIDRSKARNALENMRDIMAIFDSIEGTKNLVLFADTIRLIPGAQYGTTTFPPIDVHTQLQDLAEAANERNVRIYPVKAGLWVPGGGGAPLADDAMTMLASETGGRVFEGSNEVVGMFDRVGEDLACFYRVGFRIRPRYSGKVEPIRVRVLDRPGAVRLRYRQTLEDPTREAIDSDIIRAAFMAPSAASGFPIAVRATEMFRQDGGARLQVEIETSLGALLGLPVSGRHHGSRQVRLEIGARVIPLRPHEDDAVPASSRRGVWADVATGRPSFGFGRQAVLTLPPGPTPDRSFDRVVATEEFDAPPGRYRIVAVIQDQLARTVSATIADLVVEASAAPRLGAIGLASVDPHAVVLHEQSAGSSEREAPDHDLHEREEPDSDTLSWNGKEVAAAQPFMPPGALLAETYVIEAGNPAHLFYAICVDRGRRSGRTGASPSGEWGIERLLACGPENTTFRLPPRSMPEATRKNRCVTMLDSIPAADLPAGRCRFEVHLITPDGLMENSVREFSVVPSTGRGATTIGSLLTAPDGSHTCPF